MKRSIRIAFLFGLSVGFLSSNAPAQSAAQTQDQSSLGDYARTVRKDPAKDTAAKPKAKVFDNDNLPKDDKLSVVGTPVTADASDNSAAAPTDKATTDNKDAGAAKPEDDQAKKQAAWKMWQEKLVAQKDSIDLATRELDVLQREYQLRAAEMYADVGNRLRNSAQWDKQEADYKQKIADKQKALDEAKQKLEDMQEEARKDGVPAAMRE
ncbi:MAG TPA: hypothetical protein VNY51_11945 [Candidatus Dormibacteraeota bacterium]|jgi:hypothetical protein|nr:hypothetical protein [Candidatus Dormibacteraeota bacterium]